MALIDKLSEIIRQHGSMTVEDYMQHCLQDPEYGYYRTAQAIGKTGDFTTAPEISQLFGDLIGLWIIDVWSQLQNHFSKSAALVEIGPGRGTLMADIVRMLGKHPQLLQTTAIHLVESNRTLQQQQKEKLTSYTPHWHDTIHSLPESTPIICVANEFFDALPIRQWVGDEERCVTLDEFGELQFRPSGTVSRETNPQAERIMTQLCERLNKQGGVLLAIDYGYEQQELSAKDDKDTLQALRNHQYYNPLHSPGDADLTSHVDFTALATIAETNGLHVYGPVTQGNFLQRLGGDLWLQKLLQSCSHESQRQTLTDGWLRLISPKEMGSLFRVMAVTPNPLTLSGF